MASDKWSMSYQNWKQGVDSWVVDIEKIAKELDFKNTKKLLRVSLIERIIGTILADITASDRPDKEKEREIGLMIKLLKDLL